MITMALLLTYRLLEKGLLFGCGILVAFVLGCSNLDWQTIVNEELIPYPNDWLDIQSGIAAPNLKTQAFKLYEEGRYDQALILFDEMPYHQRDEGYSFFRAQTLLALQQYDNAQTTLTQIAQENPYYLQALWYQILLSLQKGKIMDGKLRLETYLQLKPSFKLEEAQELLGSL